MGRHWAISGCSNFSMQSLNRIQDNLLDLERLSLDSSTAGCRYGRLLDLHLGWSSPAVACAEAAGPLWVTPGSAAKPAGGTKRFLGLTRVSPEAPSSVSLALRKGFEVPPSSSPTRVGRANRRSRTARPVRLRREAEEDWDARERLACTRSEASMFASTIRKTTRPASIPAPGREEDARPNTRHATRPCRSDPR